jgi:hypothetical protein
VLAETAEGQSRYDMGNLVELAKAEKVLLSARNIRINRYCKKLDVKRVDPNRIVKRIRYSADRPQLPTTVKIHDVFHLYLLGRYTPLRLEKPQRSPNRSSSRKKANRSGMDESSTDAGDDEIFRRELELTISWVSAPVVKIARCAWNDGE